MISNAFAYARARMKVLGFTEHTGGFTFDNIPRSQLDSAYHLEMGQPANTGTVNQDNFEIEVPFTVRTFLAPARATAPLIDQAIARADSIIGDFVKTINRKTFAGIKAIEFDSMVLEQIDNSDDNGVILQLRFAALVVIPTR